MMPERNTASDAAAAAIFKTPVPNYQTTSTLKRNTACHQCRRRKLKCDSQRPCSTCLRSHAYAVAHAAPGVEMPSHPECTYDEVDPEPRPGKSKYEKLETRITELEGLLREMGVSMQSHSSNGSPSSGPSIRSSPEIEIVSAASMSTHRTSPPHKSRSSADMPNPPVLERTATNSMGGLNVLPRELQDATLQYLDFPSNTALLTNTPPVNGNDLHVFPMGWPAGLPSPDVTRHLVQAFFAFHMYAGRLFHGPTFMSSLDLHPSDGRFPTPCLLHAMCAVGSMYTADIPPTPIHTSGIFPYEVFAGRWRKAQSRPDSFAEQQVKLAKLAVEDMLDTGTDLLEVLQTIILLSYFYKCQGRWSESYLSTGLALRCAIPCGLNIRQPFNYHAFSHLRTSTILPPARSTIEDEMRNNIFWIAYVLERQQVANNSYCSVLEDRDIYQLLPVRGDKFEQGLNVRIEDRQWSHDVNVLLVHPKDGTDSFILFVKAHMMLSRVKSFNVRYKGRFYAGDTEMYSPASMLCASLDELDPRDTPAFREVDNVVSSFYGSFPPHLRNPIQDETVDCYLYTACIAAHLAMIQLHEPHASLESSACVSANKVLNAARSIMDLVYSIASTSFDISLLDHLPYMAWFNAGRILTRFLKMAIDNNMFEPMMTLQAEVSFVHAMLAKAGERMPVAYRYRKMLYDLLVTMCGAQFAGTTPSKSVYVDPIHSSLIDPMPSIVNTGTVPIRQPMNFADLTTRAV